jgi:hypothetical protein
MKWAEYVVLKGAKRNAYRLLMRKPEGTRPVDRSRRRCVDNFKIDLIDIGWVGMDWTDLAQDREQLEDSCEHGNKPSGSINCWEVLE